MSDTIQAALVQNCASGDQSATLDASERQVREAARRGADLACLPEYFSCLSVDGPRLTVGAHPQASHPVIPRFTALAEELGIWILLGSIAVDNGRGKYRNRSILIDAAGHVAATYDKIHLFDVDLAGGESYRESDSIEPGDTAVVAPTPWGLMGLTICYDLRFPALYRALAQAGSLYLTVPAAFTKTTGEAHWHALLRARAIETGSYVLAPCQFGMHGEAQSYGHSLVVDPWGRIVAEAGTGEEVLLAEVDPGKVFEARRMIPSLTHDREFERPASMGAKRASG